MIFLISGKQGSGKTSLANALVKSFGPAGAIKLRFAQPIYEMHGACRAILEKYKIQNYDYSVKDGDLLQLLGTEWGRKKIGDKVWVQCILNAIQELPRNMHVILEDTRFENELNAFKDTPNTMSVRLECPANIRRERCGDSWRMNDTHISETNLDAYADHGLFDYYFYTNQMTTDEICRQLVSNTPAVEVINGQE